MRRLLALLLLVLACPACAADYSARVVGVSDGDTVTKEKEGQRKRRAERAMYT
jgi:endonuclease YncB( thermonuclease family)